MMMAMLVLMVAPEVHVEAVVLHLVAAVGVEIILGVPRLRCRSCTADRSSATWATPAAPAAA